MSKNATITSLDPGQITKRTYDESNDCVRVNIGEATGLSVSLSAASGDGVNIFPNTVATKVSLTNASTGVVLAAQSCAGIKSFNLYTNTTATITGAQVCTLEVSPSDTDNIWIATSLTITPNTTNATVVAGTPVSTIIARRCRVSIAAAITTGTFDLYLVGQAI